MDQFLLDAAKSAVEIGRSRKKLFTFGESRESLISADMKWFGVAPGC